MQTTFTLARKYTQGADPQTLKLEAQFSVLSSPHMVLSSTEWDQRLFLKQTLGFYQLSPYAHSQISRISYLLDPLGNLRIFTLYLAMSFLVHSYRFPVEGNSACLFHDPCPQERVLDKQINNTVLLKSVLIQSMVSKAGKISPFGFSQLVGLVLIITLCQSLYDLRKVKQMTPTSHWTLLYACIDIFICCTTNIWVRSKQTYICRHLNAYLFKSDFQCYY